MNLYKVKPQLLSLAGLFIFSIAAFGIFSAPTANARIDNTPDCDTVAIIKCGAFSEGALKKAYDKDSYGDIEKVYSSFGISRSDLDGFVSGVVYRNGDVKVDGKVVATNAMTAGRNYGGTKISGTKGVGKYSVSKFVDEGQTAFVKMNNGKFEFAIVKACGNPVSAKPKAEKPKPVVKVKVCNPATGEIIRVNEKDEADYVPVGDEACQNIQVCLLSTKRIIVIKEADFSSVKHSKVIADCDKEEVVVVEEPEEPVAEVISVTKETPKGEPVVIPSTGPEQFALGGLGIGSLTAAGYYWRASRRNLINKFLGK